MIRTLEELSLENKIAFLRADFNVPLRDGEVAEPHRILSTLPTIRELLQRARKVVIASHLGRPEGNVNLKYSLAPVREYLEQVLEETVVLAPDCIGSEVERLTRDSDDRIILLENLRFHKGEEANESAFSKGLAALADVYINDAFGAAHRAHASISGITAFYKEKGAGFLMQKELDYLSRVLIKPDTPFVLILGGAKVSDKIGVIRNLLSKVSTMLIGGGMAYTFLKARGVEIGKSLVETDKLQFAMDLMEEAAAHQVTIVLPLDHIAGSTEKKNPVVTGETIPAQESGLDIGPKTIQLFTAEIRKAKMVLWNGPVGLFEVPPFDRGTTALARSLAENRSNCVSIIAGGDTVAAVRAAGVGEAISHLSTGGGATLEFLEGRKLPGVTALETDS